MTDAEVTVYKGDVYLEKQGNDCIYWYWNPNKKKFSINGNTGETYIIPEPGYEMGQLGPCPDAPTGNGEDLANYLPGEAGGKDRNAPPTPGTSGGTGSGTGGSGSGKGYSDGGENGTPALIYGLPGLGLLGDLGLDSIDLTGLGLDKIPGMKALDDLIKKIGASLGMTAETVKNAFNIILIALAVLAAIMILTLLKK